MKWDPSVYNKFQNERSLPFFDLVSLLHAGPIKNIIDLGCGTGTLTSTIPELFPDAKVIGIDNSEEMLNEAYLLETDQLGFKNQSIEDFLSERGNWDIIISNAALQWIENHKEIFPLIIKKLNPGGQFAFQMPSQNRNVVNTIILDLAESEQYQEYLSGFIRRSPMLETDEYARLLNDNSVEDCVIFEKVYPVKASNVDGLIDWVSGSNLRPYLGRLSQEGEKEFLAELKQRLINEFGQGSVFYPFKRIFLSGKVL